MGKPILLAGMLLMLPLAACGSGDQQTPPGPAAAPTPAPAAAQPARPRLPQHPPKLEGEAPKPDLSLVELPAGITPEMVERGRQIFMGKAANGICFTCHGMDAKGSSLAPDQTDMEWLHGDGSFESIYRIIETGVPQDQLVAAPAPMLPWGGAPEPFSESDHKAIAAYIYAISRSGE
ncbi:MAG: hypothetical protein KatS3mg102_1899 [Planctomycetota bacterium]|nr:MAG: hypothetical protein KatS3mg102_1899 [Planctomycetota bacterium]